MAENKNSQNRKSAKGPDKKANRRGAARLAAVQALYQMDIAGAGVNDIFAEFESHWLRRGGGGGKKPAGRGGLFSRRRFRRRARPGKARPLDRRRAVKRLAAEADRLDFAGGAARRLLRIGAPQGRTRPGRGVGITRRRASPCRG